MELIESFQFVLQYLKESLIVCTVANRKITRFYQKNDKIAVNTPNSHYYLSIDEFKELFCNEQFFLYVDNDEVVDPTKDDAYYSWKSKNAN